MRTFVILIVLVIAVVAAAVLMQGRSDETTEQPSPHAIDQGE